MYAFVYDNPVNISDPFGLDVVVGVLETGWGAAIIEPGPVGETIMTVVTVVAGSYILIKWIFFSKTRDERAGDDIVYQEARRHRTHRDRCEALKRMLEEAKKNCDKNLIQKIKKAQKIYNCRRHSGGKKH
jgi:hypothetical protein